ncbi:SigE family RNA polymerase sigma factor [Nocardioides aestuarii]|uniref:SigE family RNA polymerase sigma factor n=1 Tax=Nocardioides aestuarii TaxID=252231 RepID=A0ABW4TUG9_9ACTN
MSGPEAHEGFEQFVASRRAALLRSAYLMTGDLHDADDLVQVTLVKAVGAWDRIADRPEPYVRRILAREATNRWRRRRWRELPTADLPDSAASTGRDPDDVDLLDRALATLSPRQRAVVVLRYYDDLTERDTADALGISVGTVKSHARDALTRLRALVPEAAASLTP